MGHAQTLVPRISPLHQTGMRFFEAPRWNSFVTTSSRECNRKRAFLLREVNESATSHFAVSARTRQIQHGNRKNKIWKTIYRIYSWGDNVQVTANFVSVSQSALSGLFRNRRTRPALGGWISQGIDFPTLIQTMPSPTGYCQNTVHLAHYLPKKITLKRDEQERNESANRLASCRHSAMPWGGHDSGTSLHQIM